MTLLGIRQNLPLAVLATYCLFPLVAASAPPICRDFAALNFETTRCEDNEDLAHEALDCVRAYRAYVQNAQKEVLDKFQAQIAKMKEMQSDTYDRTQGGYDDARKRIRELIEDGKTARSSVDDLYANLFFPEDYDEPATTGMNTEEYLATEPCFAIPKRVMLQSQQMIDKMMQDLETTELAAGTKQGRAETRSNKVQVVETNKLVTGGTHGVGAGKVSGKGDMPASDITGTQKAKQQDEETNAILQKQK